ncbi:MAG: ribosome maturation factor RimM [Gemmatimonadaceae bacterium]
MPRPSGTSAEVGAGDTPDLAIVGRVRKAHGIRGEIAVEPLTDSPDAVFASGARVFLGSSAGPAPAGHHEAVIREASPLAAGVRLLLEGVEDRNAAERLRGRFLFVPVKELPPASGEEIFLHDLIGLSVTTAGGVALGSVAGWYELPQGIMLEVRRGDQEILVPYQPQFVRALDRAEGSLLVELPDGYLD